MPYINEILYFLAISLNFFLGFFVLAKNKKEPSSSKNFLFTILGVNGWLISLYFFYFFQSETLVLWAGRFNFAVVLLMFYFLLRFVYLFPQKSSSVSKKTIDGVGVWILIFSLLTLFTPMVSEKELITGPDTRTTVYGPLYVLYTLHYLGVTGFVTYILFRKYKKTDDITQKSQIQYVMLGIFLALIFGFITNFVFYYLNLSAVAPFSPIASVIFAGFITTSILKYNLFNIRVIATEIFTFTVVLIFFLNIFLSTDTTGLVLSIVMFISATFFGVMLVRGTIREIRTLEELSETKSQFLSIASHQLRTPLAVVKGYLSMLREGSYGKLTEKQLEIINKSFRANEGMIMLVNDFLNLSRAEKGTLRYNYEKIDLVEMINTVVDEFQLAYSSKGVDLNWKKPEEPVIVEVDVDKFKQVISNLVDNALKYTKEGGVSIRLDTDKSFEKNVTIYVSDTGIGIEPGEEDKIFRSFERGDRGEKENVTGAGLGLYVVKMIVEGHNGTIKAESKGIDQGTTFVVKIPLVLSKEQKNAEEKSLHE